MTKRLTAVLLAFILLLLCCCAAAADSALPSRYDMREKGIVTPVKLQYPWGSCWSFASVAAAETSILSAMGKTYEEYPLDLSELHAAWFAKRGITAADDPVQAGEGNPIEGKDEDPKPMGREQAVTLTGGKASGVSFLFSTGAGPVEESAVPYHGKEQTPEAWLVAKNPEKWIEDYLLMNKKASEEDRTDDDRRAEAEKKLEEKLKETDTGYYLEWYSGDDWTLPETDENGNSFRTQRSHFLLTDENMLPEPLTIVDPEDIEFEYVPNEAGMNAMKREMLDGHAVALQYYAEKYSPAGGNPNLYTNYDTWANYTYEDVGRNHWICIVGWDDDYPAENFTHEVYTTDEAGNRVVDAERTAKTTPPGNGAWLMKNSRGSETDAIPDGMKAPDGTVYPEHRSDWGLENEEGLHTGYNWISYYDQSLARPLTMAFSVEEDNAETGILQYDYLFVSADEQYNKESRETVSAANVFQANQDLEITAVSARTAREDSHVTFTIVRLNENALAPEDGEQLDRFSKDFPYAGFHQAKPEKPIPIKKGQRFSVITETRCTGSDGTDFWIYSAAKTFAGTYHVVVHPGESFVKEDGKWQDWTKAEKTEESPEWAKAYGTVYEYDNFGIKVFYRQAPESASASAEE
jgi:C1A family cysteine protease